MGQRIIEGLGCSEKIAGILENLGSQRFLLVCESSYQYLANRYVIEAISIPHITFSDFTPNPLYEQVCAGVEVFNRNACDAMWRSAVGVRLMSPECIKVVLQNGRCETVS